MIDRLLKLVAVEIFRMGNGYATEAAQVIIAHAFSIA